MKFNCFYGIAFVISVVGVSVIGEP